MDIWIDFSVVNGMRQTGFAKQLAFFDALDIANLPSVKSRRPTSHTLVEAVNNKHSKYGLLLLVAQRQCLQQKRAYMPCFNAPVMLSNGELSPDFLALTATIVEAFRAKTYFEHPRLDTWGKSVETRVSRFRSCYLHEVMTRMVERDAQMQLLAGTPWCKTTSRKLYPPAEAGPVGTTNNPPPPPPSPSLT